MTTVSRGYDNLCRGPRCGTAVEGRHTARDVSLVANNTQRNIRPTSMRCQHAGTVPELVVW